jgi:transcriptional regulator with XRE-family HTH domain
VGCNLETGKSLPRVDTLHALAGALSVPLQDLIVPVRQLRQVRFRSLQRLNTRDAILAEVSTWLEAFNELEGLLDNRIECLISGRGGPRVRRRRLHA